MDSSTNKSNLFTGGFAALLGATATAAIYLHPEGLKAPAFVAYVAAGAFALAGVVILATEMGYKRLYNWSVIVLLAAMFTPAGWEAFGPGERSCSVGGGIFESEASGFACRSVFGIGAIILAFMLFIAWRAAREKNAD